MRVFDLKTIRNEYEEFEDTKVVIRIRIVSKVHIVNGKSAFAFIHIADWSSIKITIIYVS